MVKRDSNFIEFIYCECGCGFTKPKYDKNGRLCRFLIGHSFKGKNFTEEHRKKIGDAQRREKNHMWKGDDVGYKGLHYRVRKVFPKTDLCMLCKKTPPRYLACVTGIYNNDLRNWAWFCVKCHLLYDNIGRRRRIKRKKY